MNITIGAVIVCVLIGLLVAFLATGSMKAQLKSVNYRTNAAEYEIPGSFKLSGQRDSYLYKKVEKTEKPKQENQNK